MIKNCNSRSSCNNAHIFEIIILDIYHPKKYLNNWDAEEIPIKYKFLLEVIVDCLLVFVMTFQSTWLKCYTHETGFFNHKTHLKVEKLYYKKKQLLFNFWKNMCAVTT